VGERLLLQEEPQAATTAPDRAAAESALRRSIIEDPVMVSLFGLFLGMPGPVELLIVALIILLLFGNRLPGVMRSMGRGIVEFKKGIQGIEDDIDQAGKVEDSGKKEK
jgi:sec-independent protein translocase protein TatA